MNAIAMPIIFYNDVSKVPDQKIECKVFSRRINTLAKYVLNLESNYTPNNGNIL